MGAKELSELADDAALAQHYEEDARKLEREIESKAISGECGITHAQKCWSDCCREHWQLVRRVGIRAAELMPDITEGLQHVRTTSQPWHGRYGGFPWDEAMRELKRIEDQARHRAASEVTAEYIDPNLPPLDGNAVAVLTMLKKRQPALCTLDDVEDATKLSRETAAATVQGLIRDKLAHRPKGDRKGATVTTRGAEVANLIRL